MDRPGANVYVICSQLVPDGLYRGAHLSLRAEDPRAIVGVVIRIFVGGNLLDLND